MKIILNICCLASAAVLLPLSANAQQAIARWSLGENDPGATADGAGNAITVDSIGTRSLTRFGDPTYSATVPAGDSSLSMSFNGTDAFYQTSFPGLWTGVPLTNFILSCDVFITSQPDFSFPVSIGRNGGGMAIVQIGGNWHLIHQGVAASSPGAAIQLDTWTHLDFVRSNGVSYLYVNGALDITFNSTPGTPADFFTIGANQRASSTPGDVEGRFPGRIDNVVLTDPSAPPPGIWSRWNLGEQDAGASGGLIGNETTMDAVGTRNLTRFGTPAYDNFIVAPGGSTLSMSFNGADDFYQASGAGLWTGVQFTNFSLVCDVQLNSQPGFSFPVSIGRNGGGLAIVQIGGNWHVIHQGVGASAAGAAIQVSAWTHLELVRSNGISSLYVDGELSVTFASAANTPADFFTIGANQRASDTPGDVEGRFPGFIDNVVLTDLNPPTSRAPAIVAQPAGGVFLTNTPFTFTVIVSGAPPLTFQWFKNGSAVGGATDSTLAFASLALGDSGTYTVIVSNNSGSVTSSPAILAVQVPAHNNPEPAPVARWNLGEDDPGAAAGGAGDDSTVDAIGTRALAKYGAPAYDANVPAGGSTMSMSFNGSTDFYQTNFPDLWTGVSFSDFVLSCDVFITSEPVFSFPVSIGRNGGGLAIVQQAGNWYLIHQGVAASAPGAAIQLNTWTHLELVRRGGVSYLYVDGALDITFNSTPGTPADFFTIGANERGDAIPGNVEGHFPGLIDNVVLSRLPGPELFLSRSGNQITLSWLSSATGFVLESTDSLTDPQWTPVPNVTGTLVILPAADAQKFFRLSRP